MTLARVTTWPERSLIALGCVAGCLGVALSAAAAHVGSGATLETSARFLLFHAPALIGLAAAVAAGLLHPALGRIAGAALAIGLALFSGDLALRALRGATLLTMAAPTGGIVLMAGWALGVAAALVGGSRPPA